MLAVSKISIAMATFNGGLFLQEQLASLSAQTLVPFELVITDDGSTDATEDIVASFARTSSFPVHWHLNATRLGYKANFMRAAGLCKGELIAFCDQDDVWYPSKLATASTAFADRYVMLFHHEARVISGRDVVSIRLNKIADASPITAVNKSAPWQTPLGFTEVFRSSLREYDALQAESLDFKYPEEVEAHDQWYYFLAGCMGKIVFHDEPLADYRQHGQNAFGFGKIRSGLRTKVANILENREPLYAILGVVAGRRSQLLRAAQLKITDEKSDVLKLAVAEKAWTELSTNYALRARVYAPNPLVRIKSFLQLRMKKGYGGGGAWTFGKKAMIKDAVLGVALAPLVTRFGNTRTGTDWACKAGD